MLGHPTGGRACSSALLIAILVLMLINLVLLADADTCGNEIGFRSSCCCLGGRKLTAILKVTKVL